MRKIVVATASCVLLLALSACGEDAKTPVSGPNLKAGFAHAAKLKEPVTIGVIFSDGTDLEGSQFNGLGEGAQVAAFRLGKAGVKVSLVPVSDQGTDSGSSDAVAQLVEKHVSGIVDVSAGPHVASAATAAAAARMPILFPYASTADIGNGGETVFQTGASDAQEAGALASYLTSKALDSSVLVLSSRAVPADVKSALPNATEVRVDLAGSTKVALPKGLATPSAVVVWDNAKSAAGIVALVQQSDALDNLPVLLSRTITTPTFVSALDAAGGKDGNATASAPFLIASTDSSEYAHTAAMSGFLLALRAVAAVPTQMAFNGTDSFLDGGGADADVNSYDSVIALVSAAAKASNITSAAVATRLSALKVDKTDGLVGPALDFSNASAVADDGVVVLQSANHASGLRPGSSTNLSWFTVPQE